MDEKIEACEEALETAVAEEKAAEETSEKKTAEKGDKKKVKKLEAEIAALDAEKTALEVSLAEANDKYMRLFAEYDNYRKRSAKEREGVYSDAYIDAVKDILPILDNMERALQYRDVEGGAENMAKGLEMIMKSFADSLAKMGVTEIAAAGQTFDPNLHNAIMHIDDEQFGESEIVEVFMKGYAKGDKVIRHSVVKVAN
ncbi:MAG: nucleotide exchange factor GrpE [Clostridia bacterium]|nr:nucleotide exchange factor GrpE [Clostridia bacterium]